MATCSQCRLVYLSKTLRILLTSFRTLQHFSSPLDETKESVFYFKKGRPGLFHLPMTAFFKLYKICILSHRCNLKIFAKNPFENSAFSFRLLPLERTFSNTRVIISKLGGVYEDIRKSPNMFARRLRIPAARGPLFEYLLMQRARVLKISTLKASEKEKHIILKIYHKLQRDI